MMITMNNAYVMITMTRPGKRPMSSMSPTIITDSRGAAKLVIGAHHLWIMMIMLVVDERWKFPLIMWIQTFIMMTMMSVIIIF